MVRRRAPPVRPWILKAGSSTCRFAQLALTNLVPLVKISSVTTTASPTRLVTRPLTSEHFVTAECAAVLLKSPPLGSWGAAKRQISVRLWLLTETVNTPASLYRYIRGMIEDNPLVSIVVSAYNRPEMLKTALKSVLGQSFSNVEVLVQDDSTDQRCEEVVSHIADQRIVYTHNRPSLGTVQNLRAGYRRCKGKYISTLNDDDLYMPEYLSILVAALENNPSCSLAFSDHFIIDGEGKLMHEETESNSLLWGRSALKQGMIPDSIRTALIAKSVPGMFAVFRAASIDLGDFPDEVSSAYDYWMNYLAVRNGSPIYYCSQRLTSYRVHNASQTSSFGDPKERLRFCNYSEFIYRRFLADQRLRNIWPEVRERLLQVHNSAGFTRLRLLQRGAARKEFLSSLHIRKTLRAFAGIGLSIAPTLVLRKL